MATPKKSVAKKSSGEARNTMSKAAGIKFSAAKVGRTIRNGDGSVGVAVARAHDLALLEITSLSFFDGPTTPTTTSSCAENFHRGSLHVYENNTVRNTLSTVLTTTLRKPI